MSKEVITLQFGNFANYVGAHYWNFQDELLGLQEEQQGTRGPACQIDSDVLYREGETLQGEGTYTPRLVLWDLSGALGGVSTRGSLYRDPDHHSSAGTVSTWSGGQEVHRAAQVSKSRFAKELEDEAEGEGGQENDIDAAGAGEGDATVAPSALQEAARQLDGGGAGLGSSSGGGGVRFFTDYLKAHLHPRSVHQLARAWHGLTPFHSWGDGGEHWRSQEQREEMMERIRFFAEESDHLQGFQVLADDASGWGQLVGHVLQEVRDEYGGSRPIMLFALRPQAPAVPAQHQGDQAERRRRQLNEGLSLSLLAQHCSTYTVVSLPAALGTLPLLRWQPGSYYHASAVCAAALDTATLPYRLAAGEGPHAPIGRLDMWGLSQLLTAQHSTPLAALSMALPCPALPADPQRQQQQVDVRLRQSASDAVAFASEALGRGSVGSGSTSSSPFTTQWMASLTPGIPSVGDGGRFAEAVVLRGPRSSGLPLHLSAASDALDAALAEERQRCVRHRTIVAQPLPVPLPFPHIFATALSQHGDLLPGSKLGPGSQDLASCAALTRLGTTSAFNIVVGAVRRQFLAATSTTQGQANLESWGLGQQEMLDVDEYLNQLGHAYDEGEG